MIDVRMFTVGPVQENCFIVRAKGSGSALIVDPGDESDKLLRAVDELGIERVEAILITHTHFDHVGAVAPVAEATGAPVYCPELEREVLANIMDYVPWPGIRPIRELRRRSHRRRAARRSSSPGSTIEVVFTPGHSPGHVTYAIRDEGALFSGDVLFQGSVGRVDLPGRRLADAACLDRSRCSTSSPRRRTVYPGHMGLTTLERERATNPFLRELADSKPVIQAPRGTFDVLPDDACSARADRGARAADPRRRRLPADRDADVRGDRAVRARRRRGDRHRPEGDVHLRRRRRALADAASRGHGAGLPRLHRARDAQAAPAGEALVPVELLSRRDAAARPLPPVLAGRRRGDRHRLRPRPTPS